MVLKYLISITCLFIGLNVLAQQSVSSAKRERNYIKQGNELYNEKRYSEAEVAYRKALQENENSETALFNLASAMLKQVSIASGQEDNGTNNLQTEAQQILRNLATSASNQKISENSYYNLGNIAFNNQEYQQSIDLYKNTLRKNPDNNYARENLRLAQLKLEEQQNQDQQQEQNQNENQDQQKNQDQKQNQDQQQEQEKNQDQQQNQQQTQPQDQQQQEQDQSGISDRNAEQILKAMENQENATRKKIEAQKAKEEQSNSNRYTTDKPW